jgi:uncharacterized membrane protein YqhA
MAKEKIISVTVAVVCITFLEAMALWKGIDGQVFSVAVGAIAALVGYLFGKSGKSSAENLIDNEVMKQ